MLWPVIALISAFSLATADALTKKAMRDGYGGEYVVAWLRLSLSLPFLAPILFFIEWPRLDAAFYKAFAIALPLEVLATIFYTKALKVSPMSLSLPFLSITPVLLIGFSYLILGEKVTPVGGIGVLLIASGGYVLNLNHAAKGILGPFRQIAKEKGSLFMIAVAVIFVFTASYGKMAITHSSPLFFAVVYYIGLTLSFLPLALYQMKKGARPRMAANNLTTAAKAMLPAGAVTALMTVTHMTAMSLTNVAYMISVKRTSLIFSVLYGYFLFREANVRERLLGASLMLAGFALIVTAG